MSNSFKKFLALCLAVTLVVGLSPARSGLMNIRAENSEIAGVPGEGEGDPDGQDEDGLPEDEVVPSPSPEPSGAPKAKNRRIKEEPPAAETDTALAPTLGNDSETGNDSVTERKHQRTLAPVDDAYTPATPTGDAGGTVTEKRERKPAGNGKDLPVWDYEPNPRWTPSPSEGAVTETQLEYVPEYEQETVLETEPETVPEYVEDGNTVETVAGIGNGLIGPSRSAGVMNSSPNPTGSSSTEEETNDSDKKEPTAPGAPANLNATPGPLSITVSFAAPENNGGADITGYTVTATPDYDEYAPWLETLTWTGGAPGTVVFEYDVYVVNYTVTVTAANEAGMGEPATTTVLPEVDGIGGGEDAEKDLNEPQGDGETPAATAPGAPTKLNVQTGTASITLSFEAPENNGGAPIKHYNVTATPDEIGEYSPVITKTVTQPGSYTFGWLDGVSVMRTYTVSVTATNEAELTGEAAVVANVQPTTAVPKPMANTWAISHDVSGNTHTFTAQDYDYTSGSLSPLSVIVTNTDTADAITGLTVALSGANSDKFVLSTTTLIDFDSTSNFSDTFTVTPAMGSPAGGPYTATVTVTGDGQSTGDVSTSFTVSFTVNKAGIATGAVTGVVSPVTGNTPSAAVTSGTPSLYTAALVWSPADATFKPRTAYTATITLTLLDSTNYEFTSSTPGDYSVNTNAATTASITGTGGAATITYVFPATVNGTTSISVPANETIPGETAGYSPATGKTITITNNGTDEVQKLNATITSVTGGNGVTAGNFTIAQPNQALVLPGGTESFEITPDDGIPAGTYTVTVSVGGRNFDDSADITQQTITFTFTVSAAATINIGVVPSTVDFGAIYMNTAPASKDFVITNLGPSDWDSITVNAGTGDTARFTLSALAAGAMANGASQTITVTPNVPASVTSTQHYSATYTYTAVKAGLTSQTATVTVKMTVNPTGANVYSVSYNQGIVSSATNMPATEYGTYNQSYTIPTEKPTVSGYTFSGWIVTTSGLAISNNIYQAGGSFTMPASNVTLTAVWTSTTSSSSSWWSRSRSRTQTYYPGVYVPYYGTAADGATPSITSAIVNADAAGRGAITLQVPAGRDYVDIGYDSVQKLVELGMGLNVKSALGNFAFGIPASALKNLNMSSGGVLRVIIRPVSSSVQGALAGTCHEVLLYVNGQQITSFNYPVEMAFNMKNTAQANSQSLCGIRDNGGGKFDRLGGRMVGGDLVVNTTSLSRYAVIVAENMVRLNMRLGDANYTLNSRKLSFDSPPTVVADRVMVPLRFITEAFGATVTWNDSTKTATVSLDGKVTSVTIGRTSTGMDVAPVIINNRTLVPLRYIAESFGANVVWDDETREIDIYR